jgi:Asp-tRNA(Asn)/Glu-tRNA(Gln) amidotransferase B subunit
MYGNEDGLINQIAAVSLTKSFGKAKKETIKLEPVPDLPKVDESLTTQDYTKDLNKLETQNEKLKLLAEKVLQESAISKHLIKELVTEVEKLKFTNKIFKDKILKLENENVELPQTIVEGDQKPKVDKFKLLLFLATIYGLAGGLTLLIISFMNIIRLKLVNQI